MRYSSTIVHSPTAHQLRNPHERGREAWQACRAWQTFTSLLENLKNPAVYPFTHGPIPNFTLLYDPISNIVNQQLQSLPLRPADEGTTIVLQNCRCLVTRQSISYINLICLTHPRRWALQLPASCSAGGTSLGLLDCLGTSRLILVPGV